MSYSIDIDEYDVLDNMRREEVLEWLKICCRRGCSIAPTCSEAARAGFDLA